MTERLDDLMADEPPALATTLLFATAPALQAVNRFFGVRNEALVS